MLAMAVADNGGISCIPGGGAISVNEMGWVEPFGVGSAPVGTGTGARMWEGIGVDTETWGVSPGVDSDANNSGLSCEGSKSDGVALNTISQIVHRSHKEYALGSFTRPLTIRHILRSYIRRALVIISYISTRVSTSRSTTHILLAPLCLLLWL